MLHDYSFSQFRRTRVFFLSPFIYILALMIPLYATNVCSAEDMIWVEDSLPSGAIGHTKRVAFGIGLTVRQLHTQALFLINQD